MLPSVRRTTVASIASLAIGLGAMALSAPASAAFRAGGGHGGGSFHGGGGFRGGSFGLGLGLGALGGYGYYGYPGYAYNDYGYDYTDPGCITVRPMYDRYGRYLGRRTVNVCE